MNSIYCSACLSKMKYSGNIPDGQFYKCPCCRSKSIIVDDYENKKNDSGYGEAYRQRLNTYKVVNLVNIFKSVYTQQKKLLDIGSGDGGFIREIQKDDLAAAGLDCDINSVNNLRKDGLTAYHGSLGGDINVSEKFDLITLWDVLEHIPDIEKAMQQLVSLTYSNAKIFIITPDACSILDNLADFERTVSLNRSSRMMNICLNRYHLHRFSTEGLRILLNRFGFLVEHIEPVKLFSLQADEYTNGFAPGILRWTRSTALNRFISRTGLSIINSLNIRNKIFAVAIKS